MPRIVAYMDDLFFQMKLAETAKHLGLEVKVATTAESLLQLLEPPPELVIVDLNARSQPLDAMRQLRNLQPNLRVIGFLSAKNPVRGPLRILPLSQWPRHHLHPREILLQTHRPPPCAICSRPPALT